MGGKVSYVCDETKKKKEKVDETLFPELQDYKTGFYSKGTLSRNENYKLGAGILNWGSGFKDPSWKGKGVGEIEKKAIDLLPLEKVLSSDEPLERYVPLKFD